MVSYWQGFVKDHGYTKNTTPLKENLLHIWAKVWRGRASFYLSSFKLYRRFFGQLATQCEGCKLSEGEPGKLK
jgi:hypothetical protein